MSATTHRLLRHMAWANQMVFASMQTLPKEALSAFIVNPDWTADKILKHIADGAEWYIYCLTGVRRGHVDLPVAISDVATIAKKLAQMDAEIATQANLDDEMLTITDDGESWQNLRSTILAEAIYHATEHRTQLIDALEAKGFKPITLDETDLWCFERFEASQ